MTQITPPPLEPRTKPAPEEPRSMIGTSKMSTGQRAAFELTEAAREAAQARTFVGDLFMGRFELGDLYPFPTQSAEDRDQGDAFLHQLETLLRDKVDPDEIDRPGEIPTEVLRSEEHTSE